MYKVVGLTLAINVKTYLMSDMYLKSVR